MKLTAMKYETLTALNNCTGPWDARGRSNKIILGKLAKLGLAKLSNGYPYGWVITEAGRLALTAGRAE